MTEVLGFSPEDQDFRQAFDEIVEGIDPEYDQQVAERRVAPFGVAFEIEMVPSTTAGRELATTGTTSPTNHDDSVDV